VAGWLSIPLWAPSGKLLGVEFRRWQGDKAVMKHYLPPSKWTATFAGMNYTAMERIWSGADVWLVEGIFDLALAHVAQGVVLACGGARLSYAHAQFISRFLRRSATAYVCFDEDATGRGMAEGRVDNTGAFHMGAKQALERVNVNVQVVRYRGGKDPGEIWDSGGRAALRAAFSQYLSRSVFNG
jgi:DNA primase